MKTVSKCQCGKRKSEFSSYCKKCYAARREQQLACIRSIVASGKCPVCGNKLRRNLALAGWYQCEQYGAEQFRARPTEPPCDWQGFTD